MTDSKLSLGALYRLPNTGLRGWVAAGEAAVDEGSQKGRPKGARG